MSNLQSLRVGFGERHRCFKNRSTAPVSPRVRLESPPPERVRPRAQQRSQAETHEKTHAGWRFDAAAPGTGGLTDAITALKANFQTRSQRISGTYGLLPGAAP